MVESIQAAYRTPRRMWFKNYVIFFNICVKFELMKTSEVAFVILLLIFFWFLNVVKRIF